MDSDLTFFATSAQVIPVLFLIIAFEARRELTHTPGLDLAIVAWTAFALVVGEAAALHAISTGRPTDVDHGIVSVSLYLGLAGMLALLVTSRMLPIAWLRAHPRTALSLAMAYLLAINAALVLVVT